MSILGKLEDEGCVDLKLLSDKKHLSFETADLWYAVALKKSEVGQLIDELKELHEQMEE